MKNRLDPIRVIVVEDSPTVRTMIMAILQEHSDFQVIGTATNGEDAIRITHRMKPDIITMDVNMPKMDGLEATKRIMSEIPTPIVVVSASLMQSEVDLSFDALQAGALTAIKTPVVNDPKACQEFAQVVRTMANVPVVRRWDRNSNNGSKPKPVSVELTIPTLRRSQKQSIEVIGIASSTGGPGVLAAILKKLPEDFPIPILIVQHITQGFGTGFANWLDGEVALKARLAQYGDTPTPGTILLAPDDRHMQLNNLGLVELIVDQPYRGIRPSANYLFRSFARYYGPSAMGIVLTGMGDDGAAGLEEMHQTGSVNIAQEEKSCIVYGMPREAILRQAIDFVLTPDQIASMLAQLIYNNTKGAKE